MNKEQWNRVKEIFHQASTIPVKKRTEFLERACPGDTALRERVEELLGSYESGFLENNVLHKVVEVVGGENNFKAGQSISHYRIKEVLGIGGMGEVFLADDTELNRPVAFKVLHDEVAEDKDRIRRFIQEARAASALNHPNILTIHEIGTYENRRFIVSEYVNGETLRESLKDKTWSAQESIEVIEQIAAALQAAHEAGIVHRDIKPENIMIRKDGLVKILDFGLAKLTEARNTPVDTEVSTISGIKTNPGVVMGTVAYMSPEQARGISVDARTDLWSLGVILYEMLSGKLPFPGDTTSDIIASILKTAAEPLENLKGEMPPELREICFKSLEKEPGSRYQTAQEFLRDLRRVKKQIEIKNEHSATRELHNLNDQKTELIRHRPTLSAAYISSNIKRPKFFAYGAVVLLAFFGIGVATYRFISVPKGAISQFTASQKLNITPLVTFGKVITIIMSPDGKYAAYVTKEGDKQSIRLQQIATTSDVEIVPRTENSLNDLSFTPDSNYLYYVSYSIEETILFRVPALGGSPTKISGNIEKDIAVTSPATVSPDGKTIAFQRDDDDAPGSFLQLANADGTNEHTLIKFMDPPGIASKNQAWSPDGKTVAYGLGKKENDGLHIKLFGINISDGSQQQLSERDWSEINDIVWLSDGNLIVSGKEKGDVQFTPSQLWLIAPNTSPQLITNERYGYSRVSATTRGDVLMAIQSKLPRNLWMAPDNDAARAIQVTSSSEIVGGVSWMPNGGLIIGSNASGNADIWTMNADGTNRKQLTANQGANGFPSMTRDGRYVVFSSDRVDSTTQVFRMNADGSDPVQLTKGLRALNPRLSIDGKWVYYLEVTPGDLPNNICKISIDGGERTVIGKTLHLVGIDVAPRSGLVAFVNNEGWFKGVPAKLIIVSPDGGEPIKTLRLPPTTSGNFIKWAPDERAIAFNDTRNGSANIWAISVDGKSEAKPLTNFTTEQTLNFDWSPDGKQLVASRGALTSEAVLISKAK